MERVIGARWALTADSHSLLHSVSSAFCSLGNSSPTHPSRSSILDVSGCSWQWQAFSPSTVDVGLHFDHCFFARLAPLYNPPAPGTRTLGFPPRFSASSTESSFTCTDGLGYRLCHLPRAVPLHTRSPFLFFFLHHQWSFLS